MKVFVKKLRDQANRNLLGFAGLTLVLWHIAQTIAFFVTIRLLAFFIPVERSIWSCFDKMSPISYFVSCFSFGLFSQSMVEQWPIVWVTMFIVQFFIFIAFGRVIVNLMLRFQSNQARQICFWEYVKYTVLMLPMIIASSLFGYLVEMLLAKITVSSAVGIVVFGSIRDVVVMTVFFYFVPIYLYVSQGDGFVQSFKKTVFSSLRSLPVLFVLVSIVAFALNATSFLLLDARIVSMGIYESVKFALQATGWAASSVVWFFSGSGYHMDDIGSQTDSRVSSLKGAENEQILETSD